MRRIPVFLILILFVFLSACSDDADEKTVTVNVPVETPTSEPSAEDPASEPITVPVVVPVAQLLTKVDIGNSDTLAIKPREVQLNNYSQNMSILGDIAGTTCNEMGALTDAYQELSYEGSTPCFSEPEIWKENNVFVEFYLQDQSLVPSLANISAPVKFYILIDPDENVHYLPGKPIKRNTFKNAKLIKSHNGNPHYINSSNKLVRFDMTSDTEVVLIDEEISNFSIKNYSNGDHFIVDTSSDVKRIKPDGSQEILGEITKGQWYDIGGSIQYATGGYLKNMIFDSGGNITDRVAYSNPVEFNAWIVSGIGGMPRGLTFNSSVSGCTENVVSNQMVMICGIESYNITSVNDDIKKVNWCDYGDCGFLIGGSIKICTSDNFIYFYGDDTNNTRLTWINNVTGQYRNILTTHVLSDLECVSDSDVAAIGEKDGFTETLRITGSDSVSPVIAVIDSVISDVITK